MLRLPESLTTIERGAVNVCDVRRLRVPGKLMDVAHDFWETVADRLLSIWEDPRGRVARWHVNAGCDELPPKDEIELARGVRVDVAFDNRCFRVERGMLRILWRPQDVPDAEDDVEPLPRPDDGEVAACARFLKSDAAARTSARKISFDLPLRPTGEESRVARSLRLGDILELRPVERDGSAVATFCGVPAGTVRLPVERAVSPFVFIAEDHEPCERYEFEREIDGRRFAYSFVFYGDTGPYGWVDEFDSYLDASPAPVSRLRRRYIETADMVRVAPLKLGEVLRSYRSRGGIGSPYAEVTGFAGPAGRELPLITLNFFFQSDMPSRR